MALCSSDNLLKSPHGVFVKVYWHLYFLPTPSKIKTKGKYTSLEGGSARKVEIERAGLCLKIYMMLFELIRKEKEIRQHKKYKVVHKFLIEEDRNQENCIFFWVILFLKLRLL